MEAGIHLLNVMLVLILVMLCPLQDQDTSGIMVLGIGARNHANLSVQFQERKVVKVYEALVSGHIEVIHP
jgi:hypothetical protein